MRKTRSLIWLVLLVVCWKQTIHSFLLEKQQRKFVSFDVENRIRKKRSVSINTCYGEGIVLKNRNFVRIYSKQHHDEDIFHTASYNNSDDEISSAPTADGNNFINSNSNARKLICITGVVPKSGPLNEAVVSVIKNHNIKHNNAASSFDDENNFLLSLEDANQLIEIGAVWAKMEGLSEADVLDLYNDQSTISSSSRAMYADLQTATTNNNNNYDTDDDLDEYIERMEQQTRYRRILSPSWIQAGTDLRVYPSPRRFTNACLQMSYENNSLLYEDTTFIVVDKPPMLPTQPDSSNYYECCPGCAETQLGPFYDINEKLIQTRPYICHRVDSCVGGCVVLSKTRNGQSVFHQYQRERKLRKVYLAVTTRPVPLGIHIHWMWVGGTTGNKQPPCQLLSHTPPESRRKAKQFWKRCILEVTDCKPIQINNESTAGDTSQQQQQQQQQQLQQQHYQSTIRLVTGRKHQVRAQLASLDCPIIHDTLYEPLAGLTLDLLERDPTAENKLDQALASCTVPKQPIGLQAAGILFGNIRVKANAPWWTHKSR